MCLTSFIMYLVLGEWFGSEAVESWVSNLSDVRPCKFKFTFCWVVAKEFLADS
jgi:hypothetical protein